MVNLSTQNWPKAPLNILSEASGSLGDLGTLVPLLAALTANGQISLPASLLFGGIFNIATGLFYDLPMCVQPMKSIAAIALLSNMSDKQISGAGLSVGIAVGLLALFGGIDWLGKNVPIVLVRGIQLGTGLILLQKACALIISSHRWSFAGYDWMDNYLVAILAFLLILLLFNSSNNLSAIAIIALALAFARIRVSYTHADLAAIGTSFVPPRLLPWADIWIGFSAAGLGQIPLTVLNSVLAVSVLAKDLYPERTAPSSKSVALSVACMNIVCIWFGSVPYCHGVSIYNTVWWPCSTTQIWCKIGTLNGHPRHA